MLSENTILEITKNASPELQQEFINNLNSVLEEYEINTALRISHFLAQAMHESAGFSVNIENLNYSEQGLMKIFSKYFNLTTARQYARKPEMIANRVYANRMGNGPESSGDGWKYRGRGIFQLTGKANYQKYGNDLGIDLVNDPDLAMDPVVSLRVACEYWKSRNINDDADRDDITTITRKINGGTNGLDDRIHHFEQLYPIILTEV